jgi:hypothetical protein
MRPLRNLALLLALGLAAPAAAAAGGDVCLIDEANQAGFLLTKPRVPKRAGSSVPVSGLGFTALSVTALPLSGALVRNVDGALLMGLTRHFQRCLLGFVLEEDWSGTVSYDCNLDNANDTTGSVTRTDCTTFVGP